MEENSKKGIIKGVVKFVIGGLVEFFIGAVTGSLLDNVECSKPAKTAAKIGALCTGITVADKIADHMWNEIDDTYEDIKRLKESLNIDEEDGN